MGHCGVSRLGLGYVVCSGLILQFEREQDHFSQPPLVAPNDHLQPRSPLRPPHVAHHPISQLCTISHLPIRRPPPLVLTSRQPAPDVFAKLPLKHARRAHAPRAREQQRRVPATKLGEGEAKTRRNGQGEGGGECEKEKTRVGRVAVDPRMEGWEQGPEQAGTGLSQWASGQPGQKHGRGSVKGVVAGVPLENEGVVGRVGVVRYAQILVDCCGRPLR